MAHVSTHHDTPASPLGAINGFFSAFGRALIAIAEANPRMRQIEALNALSDAELAERGMRRDEIVRYVFDDAAWN